MKGDWYLIMGISIAAVVIFIMIIFGSFNIDWHQYYLKLG